MRSEDLLELLRAFAIRNGSSTIDLRAFTASLQKGQAQAGEVEAAAAELSGKGIIVVSMEAGRPRIVSVPDYPVLALADAWRQVPVDPGRPFPRMETLPAPILPEQVTTADVKAQLGALMETSGPGMKGVVKLQFPDGVDHLVIPQEMVGTELIEAAVAKLSHYLQEGKNAAYAESKLAGALRGSELLVRQGMEDLALRPRKASSTVLTPTDFSFRFWTHLSNLVLQDMRGKSERTEADQGTCQSALIVGYAVFHKKGAVQREREWAEDRRSLEGLVRRPPFVFGFQELYALRDEKGSTFVQKHSRDFIHSFLREKTQVVGEEHLPFLVRVHAAAQKKDYFVQRDLFVPVFLKKLAEASEELRKAYLEEWTAALRDDAPPEVARTDPAFRRDVDSRVKAGFHLLTAMANGSYLFLAAEGAAVSAQAREELAKCFAVENILRPWNELLGLDRQALLKNARMYLPFWMTIPVIGAILRMLRRMFRGGRGAAGAEEDEAGRGAAGEETAKVIEPAGAGAGGADKAAQVRYRRGVQSLIAAYVPAGSTIDATLAELAERWNPLFDPVKKKNLVDDVNALVRDFLRPVRRSFLVRPPDRRRIHALAEQLSTSKSLSQIKKRDPLLLYIELYMVRSLQVKQL